MTIPQTLPELQALRQEVEGRIAALIGGGAVVAKTKGKQPKAPKEKRESGPSAWGDWSKKVFAEQKAEIEAYKAGAQIKQGAHLKWLGVGGEKKGVMEEPGPGSERFGKKSAAWLAFKAEWDVAHPKDASAGPQEASASESASEAEEAPKKRRGPKPKSEWTAEDIAKRAANKALKDAKKAQEEEAARAAAPMGRASVGGSGSAPAPVVAFEESKEDEEEEEEESVDLLPFVLDGTRYVRLGNMDDKKNITWASGDLWFFKKAAENNKGDYVGCLGEDGIIDSNAEEPSI